MNLSLFLFCWFRACFPKGHIDLYFDSWEPVVRKNIVVPVYGKGAKNEANVISYFLMTSEWKTGFY